MGVSSYESGEYKRKRPHLNPPLPGRKPKNHLLNPDYAMGIGTRFEKP
jgi:hypothetical protein